MGTRERLVEIDGQILDLKGSVKEIYTLLRGLNNRQKELKRVDIWLYRKIKGIPSPAPPPAPMSPPPPGQQ